MSVHIGSIIKRFCEEHNISAPQLGRKVGMNSSTIYRVFKRANLDSENLILFSGALKHDLFQYYGQPKAPVSESDSLQLKEEIDELMKEIEELKRRNEILQRENELLNKFLDKMKPA
jgi:transcriptional regulator with XRE-family HTH domain